MRERGHFSFLSYNFVVSDYMGGGEEVAGVVIKAVCTLGHNEGRDSMCVCVCACIL